MSHALVSIIIPCYNAAPWLAKTIASVRAQTWPNLETIIIDDGSTDGSGDIADGLAGHGIRVIHQANAGQSAAFNHGVRVAQGAFVQFLDADDLLSPEKIAVQMERLASLPPGRLATCAWTRFEKTPETAVFTPEAVWRDLDPVEWLVSSWSGGGMMHGAAWLIPRTVLDVAGRWDERLTLINDFDYFSRVVLASNGVAFCPDARTYYRSGVVGSMSRCTSRLAWESAFLATEQGTHALLAHENSPRTRAAAALNYQRLVHGAYPFVPDLVRKAEKTIISLGGSDLAPGGGEVFQVLRRLVGWKLARRAQLLGRRIFHGINA